MIRSRPRRAIWPIALTFLALASCAAAVYRPRERVVMTIEVTPVVPGRSYLVEGTADSGSAVYQAVRQVMIGSTRYARSDHRLSDGDSTMCKYDPITRRYSGTVQVPAISPDKIVRIHAYAIDMAGREHGAGGMRPGNFYENSVALPID